ncbi:hypothetical protein MSG28_002875 [Choristoneura fumiferana]|uniref:Uncharacterized protein n=1 Tax=Choristoneura fumiferana TaxID=7141 RepID=A0ACC0JJM2_CHOFU|nr:hypothetical protein MSG28_002875 [Choristoneura fumiferana]
MVNTDTEQYRAFLQKLQRDEFRPSALNDIKNLLAFKPPSEASVVIRDAGITEIVQCLNVADRIQVDLTCEVLKLCFEKFEVGDIIRQYTGHVYKATSTNQSLLPVPQYIDVFVAVAQLVSDKDVGVANKAIMITSNLPNDAYPKILDEMRIALEYDSSSKCNAFEVIVNISSRSPELLQLSAEHGYLDKLVSELDTDDVLYHLNILELMTRLATTQQGINHIVKHGALKKVGELVTDLPNNPLCGLTTPGYMKFFGVIAHKYPQEIFTKYPVLLNLMFDTIDSQDQATLPIALDTLAFVGSTIEGKLSLAALDIKVRALHCFASLVGVDTGTDAPKTRPIDHRVTLMTREWFRTLSVQPGPMEVLVEICKNPFPDIRSAGFSLLDAVCQHQWGEELVARTAGFVEFLLDRSVSFTKELKESKYDIVKRLSHSLAFDNNTVLRLQLLFRNMDSTTLGSGDNISHEISQRATEDVKPNTGENHEAATECEDQQEVKDNQSEVPTPTKDDNEAKIKERIAQCRSIIESLKLELNEEKSKLKTSCSHSESKTSSPRGTQDNVASSQCFPEDPVCTSNLYGSSVDNKLNYDENLMEYEKQLQKYQNTLNMAQIEKKNAIRKQMLAKAYKLKLLEVENQCNIELLRVKQSLQCLEPLQMIVSKWKSSSDDTTYDPNNFVLIPRYPELSANSGSDVNSLKDDCDGVVTDKPDFALETGC